MENLQEKQMEALVELVNGYELGLISERALECAQRHILSMLNGTEYEDRAKQMVLQTS